MGAEEDEGEEEEKKKRRTQRYNPPFFPSGARREKEKKRLSGGEGVCLFYGRCRSTKRVGYKERYKRWKKRCCSGVRAKKGKERKKRADDEDGSESEVERACSVCPSICLSVCWSIQRQTLHLVICNCTCPL